MLKIVRWQFSIAVVVVLLAAPFTLAQNGEKAPSVKPLRNALNGYIVWSENVQLTLPQSLKCIEDQAKAQGMFIAIDIDFASIRRERADLGDVESVQVRLRKKESPDLLKVALQEILSQCDLAFALVEGRVLVGPPNTVFERSINQRVILNADAVPLRKVLKQLSDRTGVNLVLDTRIKEEPKVTMEAHEMSLKTAVRFLAEMADLKAVRLQEDGFFITTKDRADRLLKEQGEWSAPAPRQDPGETIRGGLLIGAGTGSSLVALKTLLQR